MKLTEKVHPRRAQQLFLLKWPWTIEFGHNVLLWVLYTPTFILMILMKGERECILELGIDYRRLNGNWDLRFGLCPWGLPELRWIKISLFLNACLELGWNKFWRTDLSHFEMNISSGKWAWEQVGQGVRLCIVTQYLNLGPSQEFSIFRDFWLSAGWNFALFLVFAVQRLVSKVTTG